MSSISSKKEQKPKIGVQDLRRMAFERIQARPEEYLDKLEELYFDKDRITACNMMFQLAGIDEHDQQAKQQQQQQRRRPNFIEKWVADIERQDKEQAEKEAAAAQEAASRELGQIPEPDASLATQARMAAFTQSCMDAAKEAVTKPGAPSVQPTVMVQQHSNTAVSISNAHVNLNTNEIGLPVQFDSRGFNPAVRPKPINHDPFKPSGPALYA
jgi:hypothetical protein